LASRLFASGRVTPVTYDKVYPLEKLTDGLAALEKRQTWAKAVVKVREEKTNIDAKL
jgi:NADPH2:quinone reductase